MQASLVVQASSSEHAVPSATWLCVVMPVTVSHVSTVHGLASSAATQPLWAHESAVANWPWQPAKVKSTARPPTWAPGPHSTTGEFPTQERRAWVGWAHPDRPAESPHPTMHDSSGPRAGAHTDAALVASTQTSPHAVAAEPKREQARSRSTSRSQPGTSNVATSLLTHVTTGDRPAQAARSSNAVPQEPAARPGQTCCSHCCCVSPLQPAWTSPAHSVPHPTHCPCALQVEALPQGVPGG